MSSHMRTSWMNAMMEHVYPHEVYSYCWGFSQAHRTLRTLQTLRETHSLFPRALSLSFNSETQSYREHWRLQDSLHFLLNLHLSGGLAVSFLSLMIHWTHLTHCLTFEAFASVSSSLIFEFLAPLVFCSQYFLPSFYFSLSTNFTFKSEFSVWLLSPFSDVAYLLTLSAFVLGTLTPVLHSVLRLSCL